MISCVVVACIAGMATANPSTDQLSEATDRVVQLVESGATIADVAKAVVARHAAEDAAINAGNGLDAQVTAAGEPFRAEGRAQRTGASARWGIPNQAQRDLAKLFNDRSNRLATNAWTLSINNQDRETLRRRATAAGLRGAAMLAALRDGASSDAWLGETSELMALLAEVEEFAQSPRGAILFTAAIVAASQKKLDYAKELLAKARSDPEGIDALEFELVSASIDDGGITGRNRLNAATKVANRTLSPSERFFIAEWQLRAASEAGVSKETALQGISSLLNEASQRERRLLARPFADLVHRSPGGASSHPLDAFGRARAAVTATDLEGARQAFAQASEGEFGFLQTEVLLELAQVELKANDFPAAENALLGAIESQPTHASVPAAASLAVRVSDRMGNAIATRSTLLDLLPNHPERYAWRLVLANDAYTNNDVPRAIELWGSIPSLAPESIEAIERQLNATLQLAKGRWPENEPTRLADLYDKAAATHPSEVNTLRSTILRVRVLLATGFKLRASKLAEELLDVQSLPAELRPTAVSAAIDAFGADGRSAEIQQIVNVFAEVDPAGHDAFVAIRLEKAASAIRRLLSSGKHKEARNEAESLIGTAIPSEESLRKAVASAPWRIIQTSLIQRVAGRPADALKTIDLLLAAQPTAAEPLLEKAHALAGLDDKPSLEAAFTLFKRLRAGAKSQSLLWWQCELGQLEILDKLGTNRDAILLRLQWLRELDPLMGGAATRSRFEALQSSVGR